MKFTVDILTLCVAAILLNVAKRNDMIKTRSALILVMNENQRFYIHATSILGL